MTKAHGYVVFEPHGDLKPFAYDMVGRHGGFADRVRCNWQWAVRFPTASTRRRRAAALRRHHRVQPAAAAWLTRFEQGLRALPEERQQHSSLSLIHQLARPSCLARADRNGERFRAQVRAIGVGDEGDIPHLSEAYVHKCLGDMVHHGLIAAKAPA